MILAIPYFTSDTAKAPSMIAWMARNDMRPHSRGWRCEPARFINGAPEPRPGFMGYFDYPGLARFEAAVGITII